jgi:hypothetical protein
MKIPSKHWLSALCLCAALLCSAAARGQQWTAVRPGAQNLFVPNLEREQHPLNLISRSPFIVNGLTAGAVVVYDDPGTARPADYFELYDNDGDLVAVGWFDRFGIRRMAVDRGLVEQQDDLEGVFVTLLEGDSI